MLEQFEQSLPPGLRLAVVWPLALIATLLIAYVLANYVMWLPTGRLLGDLTAAAVNLNRQAAIEAFQEDASQTRPLPRSGRDNRLVGHARHRAASAGVLSQAATAHRPCGARGTRIRGNRCPACIRPRAGHCRGADTGHPGRCVRHRRRRGRQLRAIPALGGWPHHTSRPAVFACVELRARYGRRRSEATRWSRRSHTPFASPDVRDVCRMVHLRDNAIPGASTIGCRAGRRKDWWSGIGVRP